jgi:hypothetical protein
MDVGTFTRDSEKKVRLCLSGDPVYQGLWKVHKRKLWQRASLSIGAHWGTWRGAHLPGTLRYRSKRALEMKHLSTEAEESRGKALLLGVLKEV